MSLPAKPLFGREHFVVIYFDEIKLSPENLFNLFLMVKPYFFENFFRNSYKRKTTVFNWQKLKASKSAEPPPPKEVYSCGLGLSLSLSFQYLKKNFFNEINKITYEKQ